MPSITTAVANSFKKEILQGIHQPSDVYKIALIRTGYAGDYDQTTANYSDLGSDEVASGSGYTTGGQALSGMTFGLSGSTAYIDWTTDPNWAGATFSTDGAVVYNETQGGKVVAVYLFTNAPLAPNSGAFTIPLPAPGVTAVARVA